MQGDIKPPPQVKEPPLPMPDDTTPKSEPAPLNEVAQKQKPVESPTIKRTQSPKPVLPIIIAAITLGGLSFCTYMIFRGQ